MPLAIVQQSGEDDPRGNWVPIREAARLLGIDRQHLARRCRQQHEAEELARKIDGEWYLSPRLDERLRPVDPGRRDREDAADLAKFGIPAKHIDRAEAIRDLLANFNAFDSRGLTAHDARRNFLAHATATGLLGRLGFKKAPGLRTFYRWESKYKDAGLVALARKPVADSETPRGGAAIKYIANLVDCGNRISINRAMTMAFAEAEEHPDDPAWEIPSYRKVCIEIAKQRPQIYRLLTDKGERTARALAVPHGKRNFEDLECHDEWNGDECTLDIMYRVLTSRGWQARRQVVITTWQDLRSRFIVGSRLAEFADSNTILGSMQSAIRAHGVPHILRNDWGNDYKKAVGTGVGKRFKAKGIREFNGERIASIFEKLGVDVKPVLPYRPQSKPIESFYNTFHGLFDKMFASYWGGSPELRHEDRQKWVKENLEKLPTLDELCELLPTALDIYHNTPHSAVDMYGKTPYQALQAFAPQAIRRESDKVIDHLFQMFVGPKLVRRDGIKHQNYLYRSPSGRTVELLGQKVLLAFQPEDMGRAVVCQIDGSRTPLFEVEAASIRGMSQRDVKENARLQALSLRPYRKRARAARKSFEETTAKTRLTKLLDGTAARFGVDVAAKKLPSESSPSLRLRSDLESAISNAARIPDEEASEAIRTGTDDSGITLDDLLSRGQADRGADNDDDGLSFTDFFGGAVE